MSSLNIVHVAVAVIKNQHGQIFITKRPEKYHQGGLWEFPGGKVEVKETIKEALARELFEEVGITVLDADPLIRIHHDYEDKSVLLDVWNVNKFSGNAYGKEGQKFCWINPDEFSEYNFPVANNPIIKALGLPDKYMITGKFDSEKNLLEKIKTGINKGLKLIQFRAPGMVPDMYFSYARKIYSLCVKNNTQLVLNTSVKNFRDYHANKFSHGLHLNSKEIQNYLDYEDDIFTSTSVHNYKELQLAEDKKIDFIVLSPVKKTLSHPESIPLGWDNFKSFTDRTNIPAYALGGMTEYDIETAKNMGGQGIAAIGEFWTN